MSELSTRAFFFIILYPASRCNYLKTWVREEEGDNKMEAERGQRRVYMKSKLRGRTDKEVHLGRLYLGCVFC